MRKIFLLIFCVLNIVCYAQNWQWAKHFGSINNDGASRMCIDATGNIFMTGSFLFPSGTFGTNVITTYGLQDVYIVKLDANGNFIWSKRAGGGPSSNEGDGGGTIKYESFSNSIIISGEMDGSNETIDSCNLGFGNKIFLSKLDLNGNCIWSASIAAFSGVNSGQIVVDNAGAIYMTGANLNPTTIGSTHIPAGNFLAKFNSSNGACVWAKKIANVYTYSLAIKLFNNNLYIGGSTNSNNDTIIVDTATVIAHPYDMFISKFDTTGNVLWLRTMGGPNMDRGGTLDLDGSGNIYSTGYFTDTAYFGSTMLTNSINKDWYIAKYRNNGNLVWVKQAHSTSNIDFGNVSTDNNGNTYASGLLAGSATFGSITLTATSAFDMFITRYDSSGVCLGAKNVNTSGALGNSGDVLTNTDGGCYVCNNFSSTANFGDIPLTSYGGSDIYLAKLDAMTGIETQTLNNNNLVIISPNPFTSLTTISFSSEQTNTTIQITDVTGRIVTDKYLLVNGKTATLDMSGYAKGVYFVQITDANKNVVNRKVVKD